MTYAKQFELTCRAMSENGTLTADSFERVLNLYLKYAKNQHVSTEGRRQYFMPDDSIITLFPDGSYHGTVEPPLPDELEEAYWESLKV